MRPGRIHRLGNRVIVVAGNDDRIAVRIDTADHADMTAAATAHHRDCANLRARSRGCRSAHRPGQIAATGMAGALEHQVHERTAPQAASPGRIGADVFARFD